MRTKYRAAAVGAFAVAFLVSTGAAAQDVSISGGFVDLVGSGNGPLVLTGSRGFSLVSSIASSVDFVRPFDTCGLPNKCVPGLTVDLMTGSSGEASGSATVDGVSYFGLNGTDVHNSWGAQFTGSVVLPAWAPHTSVAAPFTVAGRFSHADGDSSGSVSFAGSGTATLFLDENPLFPGSWRLSRLLFRFDQGLPDDWTSFDVGNVGQTGASSYAGGVFTVDGAGDDIWGTADAFRYVFEILPDGSTLTARVDSMEDIEQFSKAGLMARYGLGADTTHVILDVNPDGNVEFMTRSIRGGDTTYLGGATVAFPVWLQLSRAGNSVTASVSDDGHQWSVVGTVAPSFVCCWMLGGPVVSSHDGSTLDRATFDNVTMTAGEASPQLPSPWQQTDIGQTGLAGGASFANGTFTVSGAGADIWGTADAFHFVFLNSNAVVARVTSMQNTHQFAKAGVMLRDSLDPGSAHVIFDETPLGNIEFMTRSTGGQETSFISAVAQDVPVWLRLVRGGGAITASVSTDGVSWTAVGTVPDTLAPVIRCGLVVTSHDPGVLNTATFDHVSVGEPQPPPQQTTNIVIDASDVSSADVHGSWHAAADGSSPNGVKLATDDVGVTQIDAPLSSPTDYFDVTFDALPAVPYTVWLRMEAAGNAKSNDSVWVQFGDAQVDGTPVYSTGTTSGLLVNLATDFSAASLGNWGWENTAYWLSQPTTVTFGQGFVHTLRVQVREDGVAVDQIVLSPQEFLSSAPGGPTNDTTIVQKP